jgi:hypothetical protein
VGYSASDVMALTSSRDAGVDARAGRLAHPWRASDEARALCDGCPVRAPCLTYAMAEELDGVWAATSKRQRRALRRKAS